MKNYIDELVSEREKDTQTVTQIMQSVSPYFQKRILNDALEAYRLYIADEIEATRSIMEELHTTQRA